MGFGVYGSGFRVCGLGLRVRVELFKACVAWHGKGSNAPKPHSDAAAGIGGVVFPQAGTGVVAVASITLPSLSIISTTTVTTVAVNDVIIVIIMTTSLEFFMWLSFFP